MILAALRDLQWRAKRFAIAVLATALVFGVSLAMSGLSASFTDEANKVLDVLHGRSYLAAQGEAGPFTTSTFVPVSTAPDAAPMMMWNAAVPLAGGIKQVGILGLPAGWSMPLSAGRTTRRPGEVVADKSLGLPVGSTFPLGGKRLRVVGNTSGVTLFGGQPMVMMVIADLQQKLAQGAPIASAFIDTRSSSGPAPAGLERFSPQQAKDDLLRPTKAAGRSIAFVNVLLWIVAAFIVGSVIYLSALERMRDFAVFKATGVRAWAIGGGLMLQSVVVTMVASIVAIGIGFAIAPNFPMPVAIPMSAVLTLPLIAAGIGVLASLVGMRRTMSIDPALAFGGR